MSLMNDMLRDLEKRQAPDRTQQVEAQGYGALTQQADSHGSRTVILLLAAIIVMLLVLAAAWWYLQSPAEATVGTDLVEEKQVESEERQAIGKVVRTPSNKVVSNSTDVSSLPSRATQFDVESAPITEPVKAQADTDNMTSAAEQPNKANDIEAQASNDGRPMPAAEPEIDYRIQPDASKPHNVIAKQKSKAAEPVQPRATATIAGSTPVTKKAAKVAANKPVLSAKPEVDTVQRDDRVGKLSKVPVISPEQRDEEATESAMQLIASGNKRQAKAQLYSFVKAHDVDVQSRALLVTQLIQEGDMQEASALLTDEKLAMSAHLRRLKAHLLSQKGQPDEAIALLNFARPDVAMDPEYHVLLAALYQQQGFSSEAVATYAELLNYNPDIADWWVGMAIALDSRQQYSSAKKAYQKALNMNGLRVELADFAKQRLATLGG